MNRLFWLLALLVLFAAAGVAQAGKYNPVLSPGDQAPAWEALPGTDGQLHALADLKEKLVVVVVFTCNSCPYAVDYEDRINALAQSSDDLAVVAINSNRTAEDSLEKMKERAAEKKFAFAYLFDESQQTAQAYGALRTPEFFLLDRQRRVVYQGALDDNANAEQVTKHYLTEALAAVRAGQSPEVQETPPVGCTIRFVRARRR